MFYSVAEKSATSHLDTSGEASVKTRGYWQSVGYRLRYDYLTLGIGVIVLIIILSAVFAPQTLTTRPDVVGRIRATIANTKPLSIAGTLLAMAGRTDTTESLPSIGVPTLILVGEHDAVTPVASSRAMAERIPGAELHVVPGAGHLSNLENPEHFNERLIEFLARVR